MSSQKAQYNQTTAPQNLRAGVHVWHRATQNVSTETVAAAERTLSNEELTRSRQFRSPEDRRDYVMAHDLLRHALTCHHALRAPHAWRFDVDRYGKPHIAGLAPDESLLEFNLSHTRGLVACAIANVPVGVDVERLNPALDHGEIADRYFTGSEIAGLAAIRPEDRHATFIELWTLKEAFLKGLGRGFTSTLDSIAFDLTEAGRIQFKLRNDSDGEWSFQLFAPTPDSRLAVAVNSLNTPNIIMHPE